MSNEGLLPPFVEPTGPRLSDAAVISRFANLEPAGHSRRLHVEGHVLLGDRIEPVGLRLAPRTLLVRTDPSDDAVALIVIIEHALAAVGLDRIDEGTLFGVPVALQMVGVRLSEWDLWGDDAQAAFAALRTVAAGAPPMYR